MGLKRGERQGRLDGCDGRVVWTDTEIGLVNAVNRFGGVSTARSLCGALWREEILVCSCCRDSGGEVCVISGFIELNIHLI